MKPELFLTLARAISNKPIVGPAECRTAISRAYYGVFHSLRRFIKLDLSISIHASGGRDNSHLLLQQYLVNCNVALAAQMGRMLRDLHDSRKEADYDLDNDKLETSAHVQACVARADSLLNKLELLNQAPTKQLFIAGLTQYKKLRQGLS